MFYFQVQKRYEFKNNDGIKEDFSIDLCEHTPYGCSKLVGDIYTQDYAHLYGMRTGVFRMSCIYGERQFGLEDQGWVAWFIIATVLNKPITIFGDGKQRRDFVYISDVIEANIMAIKSEKGNGMVFNVGGGSSYSIIDLANILIKQFGNSELNPIFDNPPPGKASKYQPDRRRLPGELQDFILDNSLIHKTLGYKPKTTFVEGIKKEIEWITKNPQFWNYKPRV